MNFLCKSRVIFLTVTCHKNTYFPHHPECGVALCEWHSVSNKVNVTKAKAKGKSKSKCMWIELRNKITHTHIVCVLFRSHLWYPMVWMVDGYLLPSQNSQWTQGEPHICMEFATAFSPKKKIVHTFIFLGSGTGSSLLYTQNTKHDSPSAGCWMKSSAPKTYTHTYIHNERDRREENGEREKKNCLKWMQNGNHDFSFQLLQYIYCVNVSMC